MDNLVVSAQVETITTPPAIRIHTDLVTTTPMAQVTNLRPPGVMMDQTQPAMITTAHLATPVLMDLVETQTRRAMAYPETPTLMDLATRIHTALVIPTLMDLETSPATTAQEILTHTVRVRCLSLIAPF